MATLPFVGIDQPVVTRTTPVEPFRGRQVSIGRVASVGGMPSAVSAGAGLVRLGEGLGAWSDVLMKQEAERQELEFLDRTVQFKDAERAMLDGISQLQGSEAFQAPQIAENFYKTNAETMLSQSRGQLQRQLATNFLTGAREKGLNYAVGFRTQALDSYRKSLSDSQQDLLTRETAANPDAWRENVERFAAFDKSVNRGLPEEAYAARRAAFSDKQINEAVLKEVSSGNYEKATELVSSWGGMGALGGLSAKFESAKKGIASIGWDERGGTSYGTYQIASRTGTFKAFVNWLNREGYTEVANELSRSPADSGTSGNTANIWKRLVADGKLTHEMEHAFIQETHYDAAVSKISDPGMRELISEHPALQEAVWSTAVQHGAAGAAKIINQIAKPDMTPQDFIDAVYGERTERHPKTASRYAEERVEAQRILNSEGQNAALHQKLLKYIETEKITKQKEYHVQAQNLTPAINNALTRRLATGVGSPEVEANIQQLEDSGALPVGSVDAYREDDRINLQAYNFMSEPTAAATSIPNQMRRVMTDLAPKPGEDAGAYVQNAKMQELIVKKLNEDLKVLNADPITATAKQVSNILGMEINAGTLDGENPAAVFEARAAISRRLASEMGATIESMGNFPLSKSEVNEYTAMLNAARTPMDRLEILGGIYDSTGTEKDNVFKQLNIPYNEVIAVEMDKSDNPGLVRAARISINRPEKVTVVTPTDLKMAVQEVIGDSDFATTVRGRLAKSRGLDLDAAQSLEGMTVFAEGMLASLVETSGKDLGTASKEVRDILNQMTQGVENVSDDYMSIYLTPDEKNEVPDRTAVVAGLRRLSEDFGDDYYWINDGDDNFVLVSQMTGKIMAHDSTKAVRISRADAAYIGDPTIQPGFFRRITGRAQTETATISNRVEEVIKRLSAPPEPTDQHEQFIQKFRENSVQMNNLTRQGEQSFGFRQDSSQVSDGAAPASSFVAPLGNMLVTSKYGLRDTGIPGASKNHKGLDLRAPIGTPVSAVADGVIETATYKGKNGNYIVVDHGDGVKSYYLHLSGFGDEIKPGTRVAAGQKIGKTGNSGDFKKPLAPHLDFRIAEQGKFVDPSKYFANLKYKGKQG